MYHRGNFTATFVLKKGPKLQQVNPHTAYARGVRIFMQRVFRITALTHVFKVVQLNARRKTSGDGYKGSKKKQCKKVQIDSRNTRFSGYAVSYSMLQQCNHLSVFVVSEFSSCISCHLHSSSLL